jgi:hypothetical protein
MKAIYSLQNSKHASYTIRPTRVRTRLHTLKTRLLAARVPARNNSDRKKGVALECF